ncbi:MAG: CDP-alcohol phosphatidyltransferase family protein [Candidatus Eisenbacteria bacterium]|nr:CDP-alcohol phosphatidyltransferase family protein [Candidatus Eisenbacteria bacterium]
MKSRIKNGARRLADPLVRFLDGLGVTPNQVTFAGLILSLAAAVSVAFGRFGTATILLLAGSICDMLDGGLARLKGNGSRFGAFLDSTIDRYAELGLFVGYAVYFAAHGTPVDVAVVCVAAAGSILVSYARARAEGLGLDCSVGLMERPERLVLLIAATALGPTVLIWALRGLAVLTHITALQRILHVRGRLRSEAG